MLPMSSRLVFSSVAPVLSEIASMLLAYPIPPSSFLVCTTLWAHRLRSKRSPSQSLPSPMPQEVYSSSRPPSRSQQEDQLAQVARPGSRPQSIFSHPHPTPSSALPLSYPQNPFRSHQPASLSSSNSHRPTPSNPPSAQPNSNKPIEPTYPSPPPQPPFSIPPSFPAPCPTSPGSLPVASPDKPPSSPSDVESHVYLISPNGRPDLKSYLILGEWKRELMEKMKAAEEKGEPLLRDPRGGGKIVIHCFRDSDLVRKDLEGGKFEDRIWRESCGSAQTMIGVEGEDAYAILPFWQYGTARSGVSPLGLPCRFSKTLIAD
jgi:hypothetical protein